MVRQNLDPIFDRLLIFFTDRDIKGPCQLSTPITCYLTVSSSIILETGLKAVSNLGEESRAEDSCTDRTQPTPTELIPSGRPILRSIIGLSTTATTVYP